MNDIDISSFENIDKSPKERTIEDLAYMIKSAEPGRKPVVLIGAGASASAGIPLVKDIVEEIKVKFANKPSVRRLHEKGETDYYVYMSALSAGERRKLFYEYITAEEVKINPTNIILAQLLNEKHVDFVFTVNFDDLLIKASAQFNSIPPVYDISNVNELTSAPFEGGSITYLHGQYYGQWLLNSESEIQKAIQPIGDLFQRVCDRTWIVVGYSGNDEVFEELAKISNFENELYWVKYNDEPPSPKVVSTLFNKKSNGAYLISGYDSDSFFWSLRTALGLSIPLVLNKPFTFLKKFRYSILTLNNYLKKSMLDDNIDINEDSIDNIDLIIQNCIDKYENQPVLELVIQIDNLINKQEFSDSDINSLRLLYRLDDESVVLPFLADYYVQWANFLINRIDREEEVSLEKFNDVISKADDFVPSNNEIIYKWGLGLCKFGRKYRDTQIIESGISKFESSLGLKPEFVMAYNDWGIALMDLGRFLKDESYFERSFEKFEMAYSLDSSITRILYNWSLALFHLGKLRINDSNIFERALEKSKEFQRHSGLKRTSNWLQGMILTEVAKINEDKAKFEEAIYLLKQNVLFSAFTISYHKSLLAAYILYASLLSGEERELQLDSALTVAKELSKKTEKVYNLACIWALKGEFETALGLLEESLSKKEIKAEYVKTDKDWEAYYLDTRFIELLEQFQE